MRETLNPYVVLKEFLDQGDYQKISALHDLCTRTEPITLKLELDYKLSRAKAKPQSLGHYNEFLYYDGQLLIGYLGICQFGSKTMEATGMVHPEYRRRGVFKSLFSLLTDEWRKRKPLQLLLLSDAKSVSGQGFIASTQALLENSEYEMYLTGKPSTGNVQSNVSLRKANNLDAQEIAMQNSIYFNTEFKEENVILPEEEEKSGTLIYLGQVANLTIGKVHVEVRNSRGAIYGLGVRPEHRGNGYGRDLLLLAIAQLTEQQATSIMLQVAVKNNAALSLYKSCGFTEASVMDYYEMKAFSPLFESAETNAALSQS